MGWEGGKFRDVSACEIGLGEFGMRYWVLGDVDELLN